VKVGSQEGWVSTSYISVPGTKSMQGRTASTYSTPPVVTPEDEEMNTKQNQQERVMGQLISEEALLKDKASEDSETLDDISSDKTIEIIGEEDDWFNVIIDGQEGWMMSDTINITNVKLVTSKTELKDKPHGDTIEELQENETIVVKPDNHLNFIQDGEWYKITYRGQEGWIQKDHVQ